MLTLKTHVRKRLVGVSLAVVMAMLAFAVLHWLPASASPEYLPREVNSSRARLSDRVSIRAIGRADRRVSLQNGHNLLTSYQGPAHLQRALTENQAQPRSLASADFDEDGVPDLVSSYAYNGRGIITFHRGNVDSIYPNAPEAQQRRANGTFTDAPFISPALVFDVPVAADFLGTGDFDADDHWDVVVGSRGGTALFLLSGDGKGGLSLSRELRLTGNLTAFTTGEINRRDGLTDVVVGVDGKQASQVLVFEGPEGALNAQPEVFGVTAPVSSLALGQLDSSYEMDLVAAFGNNLLLIHGRDRKLSVDPSLQAKVPPAKRSHRTFSSPIKSLALGDFADDQQLDIALLTNAGSLVVLSRNSNEKIVSWRKRELSTYQSTAATTLVRIKTSSLPKDELLIIQPTKTPLHIVKADSTSTQRDLIQMAYDSSLQAVSLENSEPVAVIPMRLNTSGLSSVVLLAKGQTAPTVINAAPAKIFVVNSNADTDDGVCNPANCTLREAINEANSHPGADEIAFSIGTGTQTIIATSQLPTITESVTVDGTTQPGFSGSPLITLNSLPISFAGLVFTSANNVVRGLAIRNFLSGVLLSTNGSTVIEGNKFGPNSPGISIESPNNTIGGTTAAAANILDNELLSTNIVITGNASTGNRVQGNTITRAGFDSLRLTNTSSNVIGGVEAGAGNVISFNFSRGILMTGVSGTLIQGNSVSRGFETGLSALSSSDNTIGGTTLAARNLFFQNGGDGLPAINVSGDRNSVQGNLIGIIISGTESVARGNDRDGLRIGGSENVVGGTVVGARNVISANGGFGVSVFGGERNFVQGNFIGTDHTGTRALGNGGQFQTGGGVQVTQSPGTVIGGTTESARNIISGNRGSGISLGSAVDQNPNIGGTEVLVQNNFIGTDVTGTLDVGNQFAGMGVGVASINYTIRDNIVAFNTGDGIVIPNTSVDPNAQGAAAVRILLDSNFVFRNGSLGINLGNDGITPNDTLDADDGANHLQNFPVLTSFSAVNDSVGLARPDLIETLSTVTINGTLNSTPNATFTVHWYFSTDAQCTSNQAATRPLVTGKVPSVMTNSNGNAQFSFPFDFPSGVNGGIINCTATDAQGNTSEFSACFPVTTPARTLTVASSNPASGVSITVSPNDNSSQGNGTTQFTRNYNNNTVVGLTAPATASGNNFQKWLKDGADFANNSATNVNVTMDANHTMTAVYVTPSPPGPSIFVEEGTNNLAALESVSLVRGPFALTNTRNLSSDQRTRIVFFTTDLGFAQSVQPDINTLSVQVGGNSHAVESVGPNTTTGGSYIVFRLPDLSAGTYPLGIRFNGVNSTNTPNLIIIASPSSSATEPKSKKASLVEYLLFQLIDLVL